MTSWVGPREPPPQRRQRKSGAETATISSLNSAPVAVAAKINSRLMTSVSDGAKGKSDPHANGKRKSKNK
jgi:hypothetical protein